MTHLNRMYISTIIVACYAVVLGTHGLVVNLTPAITTTFTSASVVDGEIKNFIYPNEVIFDELNEYRAVAAHELSFNGRTVAGVGMTIPAPYDIQRSSNPISLLESYIPQYPEDEFLSMETTLSIDHPNFITIYTHNPWCLSFVIRKRVIDGGSNDKWVSFGIHIPGRGDYIANMTGIPEHELAILDGDGIRGKKIHLMVIMGNLVDDAPKICMSVSDIIAPICVDTLFIDDVPGIGTEFNGNDDSIQVLFGDPLATIYHYATYKYQLDEDEFSILDEYGVFIRAEVNPITVSDSSDTIIFME